MTLKGWVKKVPEITVCAASDQLWRSNVMWSRKQSFSWWFLWLNGTKSSGLALSGIRNITRKDNESTLKLYFKEIADFNFEISLGE